MRAAVRRAAPVSPFPHRVRMPPKEGRLSREAFTLLFKEGSRRSVGPLKLVEGPNSSSPKVAVAVPKSVYKKAHDRNALKRALYRALCSIPLSRDTIVLVRSPLSRIKAQELLTKAF